MNLKSWISAARLRTLPLALSSILAGSFLAAKAGYFCLNIFIMAVLTTLLLQILSNFANDYGDTQNGADNELRKGPQRAVQSGNISKKSMLNSIIFIASLSVISGLGLLYTSFESINLSFLSFFILGIIAIAAAIKYTAGKNPYGYTGLGDLSVFIFFGLTGVCGSYYLYSKTFDLLTLLPAYSCGVFSVAVLNLNNMRDILSDTMADKKTIPTRIGFENAKIYHISLLISGVLCSLLYVCLTYTSIFNFLFLISIPLVAKNAISILKSSPSDNIDPLLKQMALATLLFVITFGIGINF